jgi:hypothetical protein
MTIGPAAFLAIAFVAALAYLVYEHKRIGATDIRMREAPDTIDAPISASQVQGDRVGPGATSNSGYYTADHLPGV